MKKMMIGLFAVGFLVVGCTGSFNLTRKVYDFHRSQDDKWVDEVIFLGCVILPVYGIAGFADAVIINSIEFWTGENPVKMAKADAKKVLASGNSELILTYNQSDDSINIQSSSSPDNMMIFERSSSGVVAKDSDGNVVYSSSKDESGGISVYDGNQNLVKHFSTDEVLAKREQIHQ